MEIGTSSAVAGALRVGVQIVVSRRRPILEIYPEVRNDYGPPANFGHGEQPHRFQDIFVGLTLINIGAERAENISFEVSGTFRRDRDEGEIPEAFRKTFKQMAPGQSIFLLRIDLGDLQTYDQVGSNAFQANGIKAGILTITVNFDGPATLLNRALRWYSRWRGRRQYESTFVFDPLDYIGDLPPPRYNG